MGQGSRRRDDDSDEYEDRHRGVDTSDAQQEVDEAIRRVQERFGEVDVDAEDVGRVAGGAAGGFGGGAAGGLTGSAVGGAIGREAGGRVGRRYAAGQVNSGPSSMTDVQGIGEGKAEALRDAGYESIEDIQDATRDELENVNGIGTAASGRLKDAASQADADTDARAVDPTVRESIEQTPFDSDEPTPTQQARREVQRATSEAKQLFNSIATTFASRTRNQEVAQAMADQIEEGVFRKGVDPSFGPTAVGPSDTGDMVLSEQVEGDDVNHELGHAVADAYGYGREWAGVQAEREYARRFYQGENDPFVANDPHGR
jgi:large subunit ribosomal protein L32e